MLTFTVPGRGTYTKLRLINEIKSYVTYLIANTSSDIYFFSNIELGHSFTNPHLHTQIWCDDLNAVQAIYDKAVDKFNLENKRCTISTPNQSIDVYHYVLKDYASNLSDDRLFEIEDIKKKYRKQLGLKLRFYSRSKSKYQKKLYRIAYWSYGVLRANADKFLDMLTFLFRHKERSVKHSFSSFISIKEQDSEDVIVYDLFDRDSFIIVESCSDPPYLSLFVGQILNWRLIMCYRFCLCGFGSVCAVGRSPPVCPRRPVVGGAVTIKFK